MQKAGVEVVVFNPKGRIPYKSLSNFRNHQKCLIVDNESCLYGSANICDEHIRVNRTKIMYTDTMYIVKGEIVNSLSINFLDSYVNFSSAKKHKVNKIMKSLNSLLVFPKNESEKKMAMQLMSGVPNTSINTIPNSIMLSITEARKSIKIISPFFSPTQEIINALLVAALRGVKIQIVLPSKNDEIIFSLSLNRFAYSGLINYDNIKIYEHHSFIHTKLLIVDDEYCVFGSANLDYRSLMINFENSIICNDKHLAKELNEIYDGILDESKNITKEFVKKNALKNKTLNIFLSIYKPLI
jgi:cardiolipin synthase